MPVLFRRRTKNTINMLVPGTGGGQNCSCVFCFFGGKTVSGISGKCRDNPLDSPAFRKNQWAEGPTQGVSSYAPGSLLVVGNVNPLVCSELILYGAPAHPFPEVGQVTLVNEALGTRRKGRNPGPEVLKPLGASEFNPSLQQSFMKEKAHELVTRK